MPSFFRSVLAGATIQVGNGVLVVVPRLHLQIDRIQKLDLASAAFRLGILLLAYCLFLNAAVAVAAAALTFFAQNFILKRWARRMTDLDAPVSATYRASLVSIAQAGEREKKATSLVRCAAAAARRVLPAGFCGAAQ